MRHEALAHSRRKGFHEPGRSNKSQHVLASFSQNPFSVSVSLCLLRSPPQADKGFSFSPLRARCGQNALCWFAALWGEPISPCLLAAPKTILLYGSRTASFQAPQQATKQASRSACRYAPSRARPPKLLALISQLSKGNMKNIFRSSPERCYL